MRGQGFGKVEESPAPQPGCPVAVKKKLAGQGGECRPIPTIVTRHQSPAQRQPSVPWDSTTQYHSPLTDNPLTITHTETPYKVTQEHHSPRGHTTQPHSFKAPSHRDTRYSPQLPSDTRTLS